MAELPSIENFICTLQKCRKKKDLQYAKHIHAFICNHGLEAHRHVENYMVPMFVECGSLCDAQQVFNGLVHPNEHSWTSLMAGYVQCEQLQHALNLYQKMQDSNVKPSNFTSVTLLKACASLKDVGKGREIHLEITQKGFERDLMVGNTLVSMYAKCGSLSEAREVFDSQLFHDVVSWNALIAGYVERGTGQEVLKCFEEMQLEGISSNAVTFVCVLKACGSVKAIDKGKKLHTEIIQEFAKNTLIGNTLVDMYAKCGSLSEAQKVFDNLPVREVVSWTALIAGYAEHGPGQEAMTCFEWMQLEGVSPNAITFVSILKACGSIGAIDNGRAMHAEITQKGLESNVFIGSSLVGMYVRCHSFSEAEEVLVKLPAQDVVSWNALIAGYAEHGPCQEALKSLGQMQLMGVSPDAVTFVCALKACGSIGAIDKGRDIHRGIKLKGFERQPSVGNTLVNMYAKCGSLAEAQEVFYQLQTREIVSWTALIVGYAELGSGQQALDCFEHMQLEGVSPNAVTFIGLLKACCSTGAKEKGKEIYSEILQKGFERDQFVGCNLVGMYINYGLLVEAKEVFDMLPVREIVLWTVVIAGYVERGSSHEALECFEQMQLERVSPDAVTFVWVLKACGILGDQDKGQEIHEQIVKRGFEKEVFVSNTLVDMYAKCGSLSEAWETCAKLPVQDVVSWNALITGYAEYGPVQEALRCYDQMQLNGVSPDTVTFVCVLKACGKIGAIHRGQEIELEATGTGFERYPLVGNTLVDMYAKCGALSKAKEIFDSLPVRYVVSWNALIAGCALNHKEVMALKCFEDMQEQCIKPNATTFTCLLTACKHGSLVLEGQNIFKLMTEEYGIAPRIDHYNCMVDLLARSGHLYEAEKLLESIPCALSDAMWRALLSGCKMYGEANLGLRCFRQLAQMNPADASSYVLMADIYASVGMLDDAYRIEELRKHAGARKKPASALIEVNKSMHEFVVGDNESTEISVVLETLSSRMKEKGHLPNLNVVLKFVSDEKKGGLYQH